MFRGDATARRAPIDGAAGHLHHTSTMTALSSLLDHISTLHARERLRELDAQAQRPPSQRDLIIAERCVYCGSDDDVRYCDSCEQLICWECSTGDPDRWMGCDTTKHEAACWSAQKARWAASAERRASGTVQ